MDSYLINSEKQHKVRQLQRILSHKQRKNPHFVPTDSWRYVRVDDRWRRPRGLDNKMRKHLRGWPRTVRIGYGTPYKLRGLHVSGNVQVREEFIVHNLADLELVLPYKHVVRIAANVGQRKREQLLQQAQIWGIRVLNPPAVTPEELGAEETAEDLSLDRELADLDISDVEKTTDEVTSKDKEELSTSEKATNEEPVDEKPANEESTELLADEFKDKKGKRKRSKK